MSFICMVGIGLCLYHNEKLVYSHQINEAVKYMDLKYI